MSEYVISREDVLRIGGGNLAEGHRLLDKMVSTIQDEKRRQNEAWNTMTPQEKAKFIRENGGIWNGRNFGSTE